MWPLVFRLFLALTSCAVIAQPAHRETKRDLLSLSLEDLLNVQVKIASRVEKRMWEAPAVVSIIRREEMEIHGWSRLSDVLEQIPGFATRWQAGGDQGLVVRGMFAPDGILVMVDGVSINDPLNGNVSFYDFPLEGVHRIEIARGPGSALYGGHAFLTVINLISTPSHLLKSVSNLEAHGGVRGSHSAGGHSEGPARWGDWKISAGFHRQRDQVVSIKDDLITSLIRRSTVGDRATDRYGFIAADDGERSFQSMQWNLGVNATVSQGPLEGLILDALYAQKRSKPFLSRLYALVEQGRLERRDDLFHVGATLPWNLSDQVRFTFRVYESSVYNRSAGQITRPYGWDDDEDYDGITERWPGGRVEVRSHLFHTLGGEVSADFATFKAHTLSAGLLFERTWLDRTQYWTNSSRLSSGVEVSFGDGQVVNAQEFDPKQGRQDSWLLSGREGTRIVQDIHRNLGALYLQDIWRIHPRLSATLGLRLDQFSGFGNATSPRGVIVWNLSEKAYLKGIYGEAFKPPSFLALYDGTVTLKNERQVYGNPKLRISTLRTGEVAFGYQLSQELLFQANAFLTRSRDEIVFNAEAGEYRNEDSRRSHGAEIEFRGVWDSFRLQVDYAFNDAERGQGTGSPLYPKHQLNLGCEIPNLFSRMDLGATLAWRSPFRREPGDGRPAPGNSTLLRAHLKVRVSDHISLTAGGSNLLDQHWRSPVDRTLEGVLPGDVPREGRYVEAGVKIRF